MGIDLRDSDFQISVCLDWRSLLFRLENGAEHSVGAEGRCNHSVSRAEVRVWYVAQICNACKSFIVWLLEWAYDRWYSKAYSLARLRSIDRPSQSACKPSLSIRCLRTGAISEQESIINGTIPGTLRPKNVRHQISDIRAACKSHLKSFQPSLCIGQSGRLGPYIG